MRIMFYINTIHHGGAERVLVNLANLFSDTCNECIFVTSFREAKEYNLNSNIHRKSLYESKIKKNFFFRNFCLVKSLRKFIKEEKPDIVISFMAEPNMRTIVACMGLATKKIISVRNDPEKEYPNLVFRFFAKSLYSFADGIVFQTEDAKKWFSKRIQNKSKIILNPIDPVFFETSYNGNRENIVSVGRLVEQKNHKLLIKAFSNISNDIDDNLIIFGEGKLKAELEELIREKKLEKRVILAGITNDIPNAIKKAKLFVLSSNYEGLPNSLMEAMSLGIPVISTDCPCGGPKMLLSSVNTNLLVEQQNEHELSVAMKRILLDRPYANEVSLAVKKQAQLFSTNTVFEAWQTYINDILKERS